MWYWPGQHREGQGQWSGRATHLQAPPAVMQPLDLDLVSSHMVASISLSVTQEKAGTPLSGSWFLPGLVLGFSPCP